jgi:syntaxin 5
MPVQDRTHEFHACVDSIRNRSAGRNHSAKQSLLPNGKHVSPKSEFSRMAAGIGKDIAKTTANLGKLAQREWTFLRGLGRCGWEALTMAW